MSAEMAAQIEANVAEVREKLGAWARHMAARYNGPVYLVGSILHHPTPRDYDIRVCVQDDEFAARYGNERVRRQFGELDHYRKRTGLTASNVVDWDADGPTQRWIDDVAKICARLSTILSRNVDLQIWPDSYWRDGTYPPPILLAAPSPRWFIYNEHVPDPAVLEAALPELQATLDAIEEAKHVSPELMNRAVTL